MTTPDADDRRIDAELRAAGARATISDLVHLVRELQAELELQRLPRRMLLWCPACRERHIDEGEFETKPHHTHACQNCGMVWRPALDATVGVRFLSGFKNA
jgi:hypothetical protein